LLWLSLTASASALAGATDWRYSVGVHDVVVDDLNSHTYGITAGVRVDKRTSVGTHHFGKLDLFLDHDRDHLDPDHIPIWYQLHARSDRDFWKPSPAFHIGWAADFDTRANTVSSIERQITLLPALVAGLDGKVFSASVEAGVGYWFLELDDDAPKKRGYGRGDLRRSTFAQSAAGDAMIDLGPSFKLIGRVQGWWDGNDWLYTRYAVEAHLSVDRWIRGSEIVLDTQINDYNFDFYNRPDLQPILPWGDDMLIKVIFVTAW